MKKTLAFLLAGVMALSLAACGGNEKSESGADTTKAQSEAAQDTTQEVTREVTHEKVDVPKNLVGTWYLLPDGIFDLTHSGGGSSTSTDTKTDNKLIGREDAISEFTVSENGTITANGKEYYLSKGSGQAYEEHSDNKTYTYTEQFTFSIDDVQYSVRVNEESEYVLFEPTGDNVSYSFNPCYSNQKYSDEKNAELTLDNWQDFFEVKYNYVLSKNDWGDVEGVLDQLLLVPKDNIYVVEIESGKAAYNWAVTETSTIHFDKNTEDYTLTDTESVSNDYISGEYDVYGRHGNAGLWINFTNSREETADNGDEYTARVGSKADVEITRIMGTVTYREVE